jgi:hypothetical protein
MSQETSFHIPEAVTYVADAEHNSRDQLARFLSIFATEATTVTAAAFRAGYVELQDPKRIWNGQDPVLANLSYVEGRRNMPVLPPDVSSEQFVNMAFNAEQVQR